MAVYGLTDQGFIVQTRGEIRDEMEEEFRLEFSRGLQLGNKTPLGFLLALVADRLGSLWEIEQANHDMMNPNAATKAALAALAMITGTFKRGATSTVVVETLCGDDASVVPANTQIAVASTGRVFGTVNVATIVQLDAWTISTPYLKGDRVTNDGLCFECTVAGTSAAAGPGPSDDVQGLSDGAGDLEWNCIGEGEGAIDVYAACLDTGPVFVAALDLTDIRTPQGGLNTARNMADGVTGRNEDTDEQLRIRRETDLATPGTGPVDAIRAALAAITGVTSVTVFHNPSDVTDSDGLPPHSVEALVEGGADQDIWDALWANVSAGIQTVGDEVGTVVDSQGRSQTAKFTRPEQLPIYVSVTLVKNPLLYPVNGDAQVKAAIVSAGNAEDAGRDVDASAVLAAAFVRDIGVLRIPAMPLISTTPVPVASTAIVVTNRQRAVFDTTRVTIISTDGTP